MIFHVQVSLTAQRDVEKISDWHRERSETWADHWIEAYESALIAVGKQPERHALAPEATRLKREIRQFFFKTRYGRRYRLIFTIGAQELQILRVRAPSERPLDTGDLD